MIEILNNKIKFLSGFNLVLVLLYFYVPTTLRGAMSFFHLLHLGADPIVFLSTVLRYKIATYAALAAAAVAFTADVLGLVFNYISISRCVVELSSECINRIFERNFFWAAISTVLTITGMLLLQLLYRKTSRDIESEQASVDFSASARFLHLFLWTNDAIGLSVDGPTFITIFHGILNPLCIWLTYRNDDLPRGIRILGLLFVLVLILDVLAFLLHNISITPDLSFGCQNFFALQYIATDVILIYYYFNIRR